MESLICVNPLHGGGSVGTRIGDLSVDKCLREECRWLGFKMKKKVPRGVTHEKDELEDPWAKLRKRRGVTIHSTATRDA